ncbi:MAG: restriction system protein [Actinomycetota bacterium]|nr:restriction system protein [Actinomycetota bacterium]
MGTTGYPTRTRHRPTITALDDWLTRGVARLGVWKPLALAAVLYSGIGLVLPLSIDASRSILVALNVMGVLLGFVVILAWSLSILQASARRYLVDWTTDLRLLSSSEFEWLVGELMRREGWQVTETGRDGEPDGNIDLRVVRDEQTRLVQCKRWESWAVGVNEVRKLAGTLMREGLSGASGTLVTLSSFSEQAIAEAREIGVELVDGRALFRRLEAVRSAELCPNCETVMLLSRSEHGWWLRCPRWREGCSGKRDLGPEPGRAVELLLGS